MARYEVFLIHHPLMWSAPINVFHVKREFHVKPETQSISPSVLQLSTAQQWPNLLSNLVSILFTALYASSPLLWPSTHFILLFHSTFTSPIPFSCPAWVGCRLALITIEKCRHYDKYCAQEENTGQKRTSGFSVFISIKYLFLLYFKLIEFKTFIDHKTYFFFLFTW